MKKLKKVVSSRSKKPGSKAASKKKVDDSGRPHIHKLPSYNSNVEELRLHADKNIVIMLIENKTDLEDQRFVSTKDAKEFAQKEGLFFLETSVMEARNVEGAFLTVLTEIFNIVNKKNLAASDDQENGNLASLTGKKILAPGPAQVIPKKKACCRS
ncbi:Ras-related protein RABA4a [Capsicum annuum]|uniref:Ras-related protein RABA4a n=2 Tax=Capsicum annuum TaxID=4072 RepID=A0A2G2ZBY8_CAPAN|nr:Ras-related protein RABA4a [Capsicum annuum]